MTKEIFDVLVIGGGPAGYTAALYAVRAGLSCLVLERMAAGGQMCETMHIDNYPGFTETIDGFTLGTAMQQGAERFGAKTVYDEVTAVKLDTPVKEITTAGGGYFAHTVIVATGATHRHLGLAREAELAGRGVGYCATCDGAFYRGKSVAVVGGGNSAVADALYLAGICEKVTLIHRRDTLRASRIHEAPLQNAKNIEIRYDSEVTALLGDGHLTGVTVRNKKTGETEDVALDGLFISIGRTPVTALFQDCLTLDASGYIVAGEDTVTSLSGIFAAGDVRTKPLRQIVTATADGAVAAEAAAAYLVGKQ
ncbi:MAG: thioredoxin-disulfide reductase [Clostridia bacterium]|nr:thioredoxin-disulfide reductase [Clostridia bacterium]